jgi:hypothetical protein
MQWFDFQKLAVPGRAMAAARSASDTDILILAVGADQMLPPQIRSWLLLYVSIRAQEQEAALVALISEAETAESTSLLLPYLERIATMGRMAFFPQRRSGIHSATKHAHLAAGWSREGGPHIGQDPFALMPLLSCQESERA